MAEGGQHGEGVFTCPAHFCHACSVSGDAQRMLRCPTAYHTRWVVYFYYPEIFRGYRGLGFTHAELHALDSAL